MDTPTPVARTWEDIESAMPFSRSDLLDCVAKLERHKDQVLAVYIGGSKVEGYGNPRSDVDVYVLVSEGDVRGQGIGFEVSFLKGQHIQFDYVPLPFVERALAEIQSKDPWDVALNRMEIPLVHRLANSVPVSGDQIVSQWRDAILKSDFRWICAHRKICDAEGSVQDAYGAREGGQWQTAVYAIRMAAQRAVDAILALRGETANNDKWIFPRLQRSFGADHPLVRSFSTLYAVAPIDGDRRSFDTYFHLGLRIIQGCFDAYTGYWAARTKDQNARDAFGLLATQCLEGIGQDRGRLKSDDAFALMASGKFILWNHYRPRQELSPRALAGWLCLSHAMTIADAANRLHTSWLGAFETERASIDFLERLAAKWTAAGYLVPSSTTSSTQ